MTEVTISARASGVTPASARAGQPSATSCAETADAVEIAVVLLLDRRVDARVHALFGAETRALAKTEVAEQEGVHLRVRLIPLEDRPHDLDEEVPGIGILLGGEQRTAASTWSLISA